ncbi:hypothetical protein PPYR_14690 [Photinus pyralis]|uniref:Uncharacterized protein n=2 Tax=Photinus pyralis TaxID=7054 RepID=A0A5N4A5Z6_PHOPY|nr:hypothetical protein PPYR_14690 [Photinus pyralis]
MSIKNSAAGRICGTCCRPIRDRYILQVVDNSYHERCLQCYACGDRLYQTCFVKDSKLFCRIDYDRLYVKKCFGCSERITPEELVMRTCESVFHVRCFACVVCGMRLQKGDHYVFKQGQVLCKPDYEKEVEMLQGYSHSEYFCDEIIPSPRSVDGRRGPKRPRTILTTQQRRAFKASFEVSPKPCRKVREALAKDTGLSIRIVQVWFQNQRAKMKKMKKKAGQEKLGGDLDDDKKIGVKEEEQSPAAFLNDSCSDSETGKDVFSSIKQESNLFLNIKEEQDSNGAFFKPDGGHHLSSSGLTGGVDKFQSGYVGFPFASLDSGQLSMFLTPPPAHKNVVTHSVHLDINPIDRLYSMQNSYFCAEEPSIIDH